jgi:alpha-amylase
MSRKKWASGLAAALALLMLGACSTENSTKGSKSSVSPKPVSLSSKDFVSNTANDVYYEIFVRSFADSNGDGIGDLNGVTEKLDYLKNLGVQGIWLMPILDSPSYHGYDVTDYYKINPNYGTEADLKNLVSEAHKRGIKVIMDLVVNHTSTSNEWFQKALSGDSKYRNWYTWLKPADNPDQQGDFGGNVWRGDGDNIYEGIFDTSMPDLNYDNPAVRKEIINVGQYWLKNTSLDGYRLDAALHIYSQWQYGDNRNNLNYQWWTEFYNALKTVNPNTYLVGEVWDSPTVIGPFLKTSLTSGFNFDLATQLINTAKSETDTGLVGRLESIRAYFAKQNPNYIDSTMITNHDMDRTINQLGNNINEAKMAASLLLTLPGTPFLYYGEEIGMNGSKPDEDIREPFIWSSDMKDKNQTSWESVGENDASKVAVDVEQKNKDSLYNWYKNLIFARRSSKILMDGEVQETNYSVDGIVSFKRVLNNDSLLVVSNMTGKTKKLTLTKADSNYKKIYFETSKKVELSKSLTIPAYTTVILSK